MNERTIATKMANALFAEAQASITGIYGGLDNAVKDQRVIDGGLWVGGQAVLTDQRLRFAPNAINKLAHVGGAGLTFDLPLDRIMAVRVRRGFVTSIVDVDTPEGTYSLRCWGARDFAAAVDGAVRAVRG